MYAFPFRSVDVLAYRRAPALERRVLAYTAEQWNFLEDLLGEAAEDRARREAACHTQPDSDSAAACAADYAAVVDLLDGLGGQPA
jgi:hypothetical protein